MTAATDGPAAPGRPAPAPGGTAPDPAAPRRAHRRLLLVCAAVTVLAALLVPVTLPLGWDELVYASRFGPYGPPTPFSAPRTRGVPLLIAPVASWSDSVLLLRLWLLLLSGAALWLGFRPWLRVLPRPSAVWVAAALYGTLWVPLFYANSAMPNHYTAMGAVAATGCLLHPRPGRARYAGAAAGLAVVTLMRPNDGVAVAAPLLAAALAVPALRAGGRWRGRSLAVVAGVAAGALPWVVEAQVRFGGVPERLARAGETQGGISPVLSLTAHLTALDGPLLCRPCAGDGVRLPALGWWVLLPALVALGLWAARRAGAATGADAGAGRAPLWLAVAVAAASMAPYLLLVPYAAPRFLLPGYALLALPAALGLLAAADRARRSRPLAAALVLVMAGQPAVQLTLAHAHGSIQERARDDWRKITEVLREHGVAPPCGIKATSMTIPLAHTAGCAPLEYGSPARPDAVVLREAEPPEWARDWPLHPVPDTYNPGWRVAVRP
ncbi:hypothetical protein V1L54_23785 [Streptomyces sp. TRM 70361]|uniref:hypothetical protein n=1 Tax=Streptomyces sp. TRM 70361 TaxID=3116553 RepID=UPI002E7C24D4|nr:hypothetical protein [Streptomyces sp. TRM 70361]MEE1942385.1 hypothetical protein [Streptomyces sp. TRM 70361]